VAVTRKVQECKTVCEPRTVCRQVPTQVMAQVPVVRHCPPAVLPSAQSVLATEQSVTASPQGIPVSTTIPPCGPCDDKHPLLGLHRKFKIK
jgi:hypothetical protein